MHAAGARSATRNVLMSDGRCTGQPEFPGHRAGDQRQDRRGRRTMFGALADGGQVTMPLAKTFFSSRFGMLADKFGVGWMVLVAQ